jgi:hypothetical protein
MPALSTLTSELIGARRVPDLPIGPIISQADHFTASELQEYLRCRDAHRLRYLHGVTRAEIRKDFSRPTPAEWGSALHLLLAQDGGNASDDQRARLALHSLVKHWATATPLKAEPFVPALVAEAERFYTSRWGRALRDAAAVEHELRFAFALHESAMVDGTIDLAYSSPRGWTLLDFKTPTLPADRGAGTAAVQHAIGHELQAAVYTMAMIRAGHRVRRFVFYYTKHDLAVVIVITPVWLETWRWLLLALIDGVRAESRRFDPLPVISNRRCDPCSLRVYCNAIHQQAAENERQPLAGGPHATRW